MKEVVLPNGLRVVVAPQPQLHRTHVALYVRVGSRFETRATNGISHFLEHMLYRGTPRLESAHLVNLAFERIGGYLYAATQADFGVYSITLPPESLDEACGLFSEVLTEPLFRDIELEKGIVCEEILEDLDDDGRQIDADNLSREMIYPTHPLGFTITGDEETVRSFDEELCAVHHAKHYGASNAVLAFSGAVSEKDAILLAEKHFAKLPRGTRTTGDPPVHTQKKPRVKIVENVSSQTELRVCFRAIPENAPVRERAAMDMLMRVIDDGMSTRLYHRVCDAQGLCYDVSAGYDGYEDDGVMDFVAGVQHQRTTRLVQEILALMTELAKEGPTEDELAKARHRHDWELRALLDSAEELAAFHAAGLLFNRYESIEDRRTALNAVKRDEVAAMAARIARPDRLNVVAVGLLESGEDRRLTDAVKGWKGL